MIELSEFYSKGDEQRFFNALQSIPGVQKIKGVGTGLCLTLNISRLSRDGLFDLVGLLRRYSIPLRPLSLIAEKPKFEWVCQPHWYWAAAMFGQSENVLEDSTGH